MQNTPVEAPGIEDPIPSTGKGPETPPGEAQGCLTINSGVQVGDGSEAEDDIPF